MKVLVTDLVRFNVDEVRIGDTYTLKDLNSGTPLFRIELVPDTPQMRYPTLCLDFDGVIHAYTSGWKGADVIPDGLVPGAIEFVESASNHFSIAIYSTRSSHPNGIDAMQKWLGKHILEYYGGDTMLAEGLRELIYWPTEKPPAFITIDDRVHLFTGTWPSLDELAAFKAWNK